MIPKKVSLNKTLLNIKIEKENIDFVKYNKEKIYSALMSLDEKKDSPKYLSLSCIYGAFLGDSMGASCEFLSPSPKNHQLIFKTKDGNFDIGEVTDDSEMAISAAFAYLDSISSFDKNSNILYYYYCIWVNTQPKDVGETTIKALENWNQQNIEKTVFNKEYVEEVNMDSLANGFLMRLSTFIVFYYYKNYQTVNQVITDFHKKKNKDFTKEILDLFMDILEISKKNVIITHPNPENVISGAIFSLMTLAGMVTKSSEFVYKLFELFYQSKLFIQTLPNEYKKFGEIVQKKYSDIVEEIKLIEKKKSVLNVFDCMGYYIHAIKLCIYFLRKYKNIAKGKNLFNDIMNQICDLGGDTDTNCAIVGTLIGPMIGYKKFPKDYFKQLIYFVPETRSQFNSALMYMYVDYLEDEYFNSDEDEEEEIKDDKKQEKTDKPKKIQIKSYGMINEFFTTKLDI